MDKFLWIDMEMTGLVVEKERIIEVAAIVTDGDLNEIDSYESVIFQEQIFLDNMDEWNTKQHAKSGLVLKIPKAPKQDSVEDDLCQFVKKHFGEEPAMDDERVAALMLIARRNDERRGGFFRQAAPQGVERRRSDARHRGEGDDRELGLGLDEADGALQ